MNKLLLEFMRENELDNSLIYKNAAERQMIFVRDKIGTHLTKSPIFVVSTHRSKSCLLPVYFFRLTNGIEFIMRENFYGWVVSIRSPFVIDELPSFCRGDKNEDGTNDIHEVYCEGFKHSWVYAFNNKNFNYTTFRVREDYDLYTLIYQLNTISISETAKPSDIGPIAIEICVNEVMRKHPSLDSIYELFPETYFTADDYHFCKQHEIEGIPYAKEMDEKIKNFAERVGKYPELQNLFHIEIEKLYNGENFE